MKRFLLSHHHLFFAARLTSREGRFAQALFQSCQHDSHRLQAVREELNAFSEVYVRDMAFKRFLSALTPFEANSVFGDNVSATFLRFLGLLVDKKSVSLLPTINRSLENMINYYSSTQTVIVRYATTFSNEQKAKLNEMLKSFFQVETIICDFQNDPRILGGCIVEGNGFEIDASWLSQFRQLSTLMYKDYHKSEEINV